MINAVKRRFV